MLTVVGLIVLAAGVRESGSAPCVVLGMMLFGIGFGAVQSVTLTTMLDRAPRETFGVISTVWNAAYDAGWGLGGVALGLLVSTWGYASSFLASALLILAVCVVAMPFLSPSHPGECHHA